MRLFTASLACLAALSSPAIAFEKITSAQLGKLKLEAAVPGVPISGCIANKTNLVCEFPLRGGQGLVYTLYDAAGKKLQAVAINNTHVVRASRGAVQVRLPYGKHAAAVARLTITRAGDPDLPAQAQPAKAAVAAPAERPRSTAMDGTMGDWSRAAHDDKVTAMTSWLQDVQRAVKKPVKSADELSEVTKVMIDTMDIIAPEVPLVSARTTARYMLMMNIGLSEGKSLDEIKQAMRESAGKR